MIESTFKTKLCSELESLLPGCIILHPNPNEIQGFPDLLILFKNTWFALEGKQTSKSSKRPNQPFWVNHLNKMSFARFISPENKEEILNEIQQTFRHN